MTPNDPLARRAQYLLPRESLADLGIFSRAAADADATSAAVRHRTPARAGGNAGGPIFEFGYLARALIDVSAVLFGLFFMCLLACAVGVGIFALWLALQ